MSHPNRLSNGGFSGDLANWTAGGGASFVANQGNDELGVASLAASGDYIEQDFAIGTGRQHMLDVFIKSVTGTGNLTVTITDSNSNVVYTASLSVTATWANAGNNRIGLPDGNYTLRLTYDDVAVYVDDVSIAWVIKTRMELAKEAHKLLGVLATSDANYSTNANGELTEGDYTEAVDAALRAVGAVNERADPDARWLTDGSVDSCVDEVQRYMLHKLHRYYARNATDFTLEGRTEHYHQRVNSIENLLGISVGGRPASSSRSIQTRKLIHRSGL